MKGNLERLKKALKAFAKRMKGFKYTNLAVIVFLLVGIIGRAENSPTGSFITNTDDNSVGVYIDTSGKNNNSTLNLAGLGINRVKIFLGPEVTRNTNEKNIVLSGNDLKKVNDFILNNPNIPNIDIFSSSLSWQVAPVKRDDSNLMKEIILSKIPYNSFAHENDSFAHENDSITHEILDLLDQNYSTVDSHSRGKEVYNFLDQIGKGEGVLLAQTIDSISPRKINNKDEFNALKKEMQFGVPQNINGNIHKITIDPTDYSITENDMKNFKTSYNQLSDYINFDIVTKAFDNTKEDYAVISLWDEPYKETVLKPLFTDLMYNSAYLVMKNNTPSDTLLGDTENKNSFQPNIFATTQSTFWNVYLRGAQFFLERVLNNELLEKLDDKTSETLKVLEELYGITSNSEEKRLITKIMNLVRSNNKDTNFVPRTLRVLSMKNGTQQNKNDDVIRKVLEKLYGKQYANTQQRVKETSDLLNNEFEAQRRNVGTERENTFNIFGVRNKTKYSSENTYNYKNGAMGITYLNKNGLYAGVIQNNFDFEDKSKSKEKQTMLKLGFFKDIPFGNTNTYWTVATEGFIGKNEMKRKFNVEGETFIHKADYDTYGLALKNRLSKNFNVTSNMSVNPYTGLDIEYGKFKDIKEKSGVIKLDVKGNNYTSIAPKIGFEVKYNKPFAKQSAFNVALDTSYEYELGNFSKTQNKVRFADSKISKYNDLEKQHLKKGNLKTDLKLGVNSGNWGISLNSGYDVRKNNFRTGLNVNLDF